MNKAKIADMLECSKVVEPECQEITYLNMKFISNLHISDFKNKSLRNACMNGNLEMVRKYYQPADDNFAHIAAKYGRKYYQPADDELAHIAARYGRLYVLCYLIGKGISPDIVSSKYNETLLHVACENKHLDIVEYLLDIEADPNKRTKFGRTPLSYACQYGSLDIVKMLIRYKADISLVCSRKDTILHDASHSGNYDIVKYLLELGMDPLKKNRSNETPIDQARRKGYESVERCLLGIPEPSVTEPSRISETSDADSDDDLFGRDSDDDSLLAGEKVSVHGYSDVESCCSVDGGDD